MDEKIPRDVALRLYETMSRIRKFEEAVVDLYARGKLPGFLHTYIEEEAVAAGVCADLRLDDKIISTHRGHGHMIAKGADTSRMMAELYGKRTGSCKGKGGSMHIADIAGGNLGATGVVGGGIPTAVGIALALQMRRSDQILLSYFGDGATNEGEFHESLNMASTWKLPVVFICDNNQYGMSMHVTKVMNIQHISERAASYGIPGKTVDGNDVTAVYSATLEAASRARSGRGPTLLELETYRRGLGRSSARSEVGFPEAAASGGRYNRGSRQPIRRRRL